MLHPDVAVLAPLLGAWSGKGSGLYPTIESFEYSEDISFGHVGKPFLAYRQATVRLDTGVPAHAEVGYLRGVGANRVELVLAHPSGIAELAAGEVQITPKGLQLRLMSTTVTRTPTAKEVSSVERTFIVAGDVLRYELAMAAVGQPHQRHLTAELHRLG